MKWVVPIGHCMLFAAGCTSPQLRNCSQSVDFLHAFKKFETSLFADALILLCSDVVPDLSYMQVLLLFNEMELHDS